MRLPRGKTGFRFVPAMLRADRMRVAAVRPDDVQALRERAEKAEAERDALCTALGFKPGPITKRPIILHEIAGLRPAMVKARREAERAEGDAAMWRLSAADRHNDKPLLLTVWQQRKAAENRATAAEAQVADITARAEKAEARNTVIPERGDAGWWKDRAESWEGGRSSGRGLHVMRAALTRMVRLHRLPQHGLGWWSAQPVLFPSRLLPQPRPKSPTSRASSTRREACCGKSSTIIGDSINRFLQKAILFIKTWAISMPGNWFRRLAAVLGRPRPGRRRNHERR